MDIKINENDKIKSPMKVVGTYVSADIYERLKKESEDNFMSVSSLVKKVIYLYINYNILKIYGSISKL